MYIQENYPNHHRRTRRRRRRNLIPIMLSSLILILLICLCILGLGALLKKKGIHKTSDNGSISETETTVEESKNNLEDLLSNMPGAKPQEPSAKEEVKVPAKKTVEAGIPGIDVIEIEDACKSLWKAGIYAETGMGCTGPVIMVSSSDFNASKEILKKAGYIS